MAKINQVVRFEPFGSALTLRDAMDRLLQDSFVWPRDFFSSDSYRGNIGALALNMYETPDELVVTTVLPGVKSDDVNIQFEDGRLIIDSTIPAPKMENVTWHFRELPYGQYHREITLPVAINTDKVEATLQDGYLTLRLPKADQVKPKKIQVKTTAK